MSYKSCNYTESEKLWLKALIKSRQDSCHDSGVIFCASARLVFLYNHLNRVEDCLSMVSIWTYEYRRYWKHFNFDLNPLLKEIVTKLFKIRTLALHPKIAANLSVGNRFGNYRYSAATMRAFRSDMEFSEIAAIWNKISSDPTTSSSTEKIQHNINSSKDKDIYKSGVGIYMYSAAYMRDIKRQMGIESAIQVVKPVRYNKKYKN